MKLNTIYSYFIIILFSPLIGKLIKNITIYYKSYKEFKKSDLLYNLVHRLTPHEFEIWCSEYLSNIGFNNIVVLPLGPDGGKDIICEKNSEKFYVECKRYSISDSITAFEIEKLLGAMICDNINNGIIITSDGTTIVMIKKMNNLSFPLKSIFANAYPASEHTVTVRITPTTATNTLLNT